MESSHRGLRRVAALALEVVASKSEIQGHLSGCGEQSSRTWSSFHLTRGTIFDVAALLFSVQGLGSALINADPDTDPDPSFFLIADPDPGSGSRV